MKRCREKEEEDPFPFDSLADNALQLTLAFARHSVSHLNTVSKQWYHLLNTYHDWQKIFFHNLEILDPTLYYNGFRRLTYIRLLIENSPVCKNLSESGDVRYECFLNYLWGMLNTRLCRITKENDSDDRFPLLDSITLYIRECSQNALSMRNFHKRDFYLNFVEEGHRYYLVLPNQNGTGFVVHHTDKVDDNEAVVAPTDLELLEYILCSVTTFIHSLFPEFNEDEVIDNMMVADKWHDPVANSYYNMTKEEIKAQWLMIRTQASLDGTAMHANLEMFYSGRKYHTNTKEFALFLQYEKVHVTDKLRVFRTEWTIYNIPLQLCGSVDILYEYITDSNLPPSKLSRKRIKLCDWKRSRRVSMYNSYQSGSKPCTMNSGACNYIYYSVQFCLYADTLEEFYDVTVDDQMLIVVLHPNQDKFICHIVSRKAIRPFIDGIKLHRLAYVANTIQKRRDAFLSCEKIENLNLIYTENGELTTSFTES